MILRFTIHTAPKTKKNSLRIVRNRKTGLPFVMQSKQHEVWARVAVMQLRTQFALSGVPCSITTPVNMAAVVYRERATGDLLNYLAAVSDALEHAGVIVNDKQIVSLDGCRMAKDKERPRIELTITTLEAA